MQAGRLSGLAFGAASGCSCIPCPRVRVAAGRGFPPAALRPLCLSTGAPSSGVPLQAHLPPRERPRGQPSGWAVGCGAAPSLCGLPGLLQGAGRWPRVCGAAGAESAGVGVGWWRLESVRGKMVKSSSYRRRSRASPTGQAQKAHLGPVRLAGEFVAPGTVLVRQRRWVAWGFEGKRRRRHVKLYPGENVGVAKDSSLVALVHGRVKFTREESLLLLEQQLRQLQPQQLQQRALPRMRVNVLPEPREELLAQDLWRYRTEAVASPEENRLLCALRQKGRQAFDCPPRNPPRKPLPRPKALSRHDPWQPNTLPDAPPLCEDR
ncbi:hypothetical protein, conserved [Eimeria tenella]|uniref:Ribosomal protein L27 n=1 Tax=Eimeria tenella TaxID=5802 RepID=U6KWK7_EIMTE|nr:hypothetical protein, conserved [Eimeria tenella]CDJ40739.1 hypothetical protein, conserved [Eimeria tenella]|eukprot:XP_013231489.1 hypothetical protein, conserved [Eimeria tenella]